MYAPRIAPDSSNCISKCFPKREELLLRSVFAFPNDSSTGFVSISLFATYDVIATMLTLLATSKVLWMRKTRIVGTKLSKYGKTDIEHKNYLKGLMHKGIDVVRRMEY